VGDQAVGHAKARNALGGELAGNGAFRGGSC